MGESLCACPEPVAYEPMVSKQGRLRLLLAPERLQEHRRGSSYWTSRATDWRPVFEQDTPDEDLARLFEERIKARGARRYLFDVDLLDEASPEA